MLRLIQRITNWFACWRPWGRRQLRTVYVEELPEQLDRKNVYVVGEGVYRWFVALLCPCGCGETLYMSLYKEGRPRWTLAVHEDDSISLQPSVWRKGWVRESLFSNQRADQVVPRE